MIGSLFAGISGLNANATAMTVVGDNIANVNTTAFKSNRFSFANILSQSLGGSGGNDIGRGVDFWGTTALWSQGSLENTSNPTDMAINGRGFFMVNDNNAATFYTRAGEFTFDNNGDLRNPDGYILQGYQVTGTAPNGSLILGNISDISIPGSSVSPPQTTTTMSVDVNVDSGAAIGDTYNTSITVYDTLGNSIPLTLTFEKIVGGGTGREWQVTGSVPASVNGTGTVGITNNNLTFDNLGNLNGGADPSITINGLVSGAANVTINWDIFDAGGVTNGDITQYAAPSATTFQTQDGYPAGSLRSVAIDEAGVVTGSYSNGQLTPLFQVALADFPSLHGLTKLGHNLYAESLDSGQPLPGTPGSGTLGSISPSALEMSNVDLAQEFVKMITTQRAFQANSRVITTSDEVLTELINIKR